MGLGGEGVRAGRERMEVGEAETQCATKSRDDNLYPLLVGQILTTFETYDRLAHDEQTVKTALTNSALKTNLMDKQRNITFKKTVQDWRRAKDDQYWDHRGTWYMESDDIVFVDSLFQCPLSNKSRKDLFQR